MANDPAGRRPRAATSDAWRERWLRLAGQLFGVSPYDPVTFAAVAGGLGIAALVAGYLPARRAVRVAPASSLRGE